MLFRTARTGSACGDDLSAVDVTSPAFKADPFPFYARLRTEAPVLPVTAPRIGRACLVTRYDDVADVLKDARLAKNPKEAMTPEQLKKARTLPKRLSALQTGLLSTDGADHDRLRALVRHAFTARRVEQMRDQAQVLADELLDAAVRRGGMDVIADYALPLPLVLIGRIIGVPETDNPKFSAWSTALISAPQRRNPLTAMPAILMFLRYLRTLITERTQRPADDLISALAAAREGDDRLTDDEILAMCVLLLTAGHETTRNLIASGTLALLQHPEQLTRLRDDPALIYPGIEELLRFVVPAEMATERYARNDIEIAGTTIPCGSLVLAVLASANRDPAYFEKPDTLDIGRTPNRHLSFGQGMHYCLGAPLARLEGQIAITTLLRRAPTLRLAVSPEQLRWRGGIILRGLNALPVSLS
ncbi:MAG TPA: cytochrome P450 [Mycobacterium sp.]|uniref:cytochrome P450 family protein n=1 Tax=Mycobacterium sp. TaxID=1785 RepID=UPI002BE95980|nr:cytochrome P450 [Mycobacterium sp.]HME77798.1 cytochrome P450 [Mycobacterium sp.]